jgi:excisionase family DNA binding protein
MEGVEMASQQAVDEPGARRLYTVDEAAEVLRVSRSHLYQEIAQGRVAGVIRIGRSIRIDLATLLGQQVSA